MSNLGIGVMIAMLGGNEKAEAAVKQSVGKTIAALALSDDVLTFTFEDKSELKLQDDGQSCCEHRYMQTDDQLSDYIGGKLVSIELRDAPEEESDGDVHEVQFLAVQTSKGEFVVASHNEHNGYYGGFSITASVTAP